MAGGSARIVTAGVGGTATFVGGSLRRPLAPPDDGRPSDVARAFVDRYGPAFGVEDPSEDLVEDRSEEALAGGAAVRFRQEHHGVPVLAGEIAVQLAADGRVLSTAGEALPYLDVATDPTVTAASAAALALAVTVRDEGVAADTLETSAPELLIYDPALIGAPGELGARLVWRVDVRTPIGDVDRFVLVDARTGAISLHFDQREDVLSRQVCNRNNVPGSFATATCTAPVRTEGQGATGNVDVDDAYDLSGETYAFYSSRFGRDSVDGAGLALKSTVRFCVTTSPCPYINAFWNGAQMVYGEGFASGDDVVGHELTHGFTQYTSELMYFGEAGAINESISDVMGELMDLDTPDAPGERWLLAEDIMAAVYAPGPPLAVALRDMQDPPAFGDPDRAGSPLYEDSILDSAGVHINSGVSNKAAYLMTDGDTFNGQTITGIGSMKTSRIYYQAATTLLGPGSDFLDLFNALQQACTNLVGTIGITGNDCEQVRKAVTATEMNFTEATDGAYPSAPLCPTGMVLQSTLFSDAFESPTLSQWSSTALGAGSVFSTSAGTSQSGVRSMHVDDPSSGGASRANTLAGTSIPAGVSTFLRFDHWYQFDHTDRNPQSDQFWDGGLVGLSTTGANGTYNDIGGLGAAAAVNGYDHVLEAGGANPYNGRAAFAGVIPTFQRSRFDLSALAGQSVNVGFFFGADSSVGAEGWFIDDVTIYTCAAPPPPGPTSFVPVGPERVFDTRPGNSPEALVGVPKAQVLPGADLAVQVSGLSGGTITPATGLGAVSLNVAVTNPAAAGFVTVYPCVNRKLVASVNFGAGQTVSNAVIAPVSPSGTVCFYSLVPTDLIVDINGWFPSGASYTAVGPERVFDTRGDSPNALVVVPDQQVSPASDLLVQVSGLAGGTVTPTTGLGAVSMNVAVTNPQAAGFVTVYPCANRKLVASVNFAAGATLSNAVIAPVSAAGTICFYSLVPTDLIVDINGWFPSGASFTAVGPERVFDTRPGNSPEALVSVPKAQVLPGADLAVQVSGLGAGAVTPATGLGAVSLNVAVTNPAAAGFVTVYPCANRKLVASVNFGAGQTVSNAVIAPVSAAGTICFYSLVPTDLIVDINGWFPTN
jgi:bacillolysin